TAPGLARCRPRSPRRPPRRRGRRHRGPAPARPLPGRALPGEPGRTPAGGELRHVALPLVSPFRTSFGVERDRDVLLVRGVTDGAEGWGECGGAAEPPLS